MDIAYSIAIACMHYAATCNGLHGLGAMYQSTACITSLKQSHQASLISSCVALLECLIFDVYELL